MSALKASPKYVGPRWTKWAYGLALEGAGDYDEKCNTWTIPVEWEDSVLFPELKTLSKVYVREDRGEVFGSSSPF